MNSSVEANWICRCCPGLAETKFHVGICAGIASVEGVGADPEEQDVVVVGASNGVCASGGGDKVAPVVECDEGCAAGWAVIDGDRRVVRSVEEANAICEDALLDWCRGLEVVDGKRSVSWGRVVGKGVALENVCQTLVAAACG